MESLRGKGKAKDSISKPKPKPKNGPKPDTKCFHCHEIGDSKRNCIKYLASLKKGGSKTSSLGTLVINVIDIFSPTLLLTHGYLIPDRLLTSTNRCRG